MKRTIIMVCITAMLLICLSGCADSAVNASVITIGQTSVDMADGWESITTQLEGTGYCSNLHDVVFDEETQLNLPTTTDGMPRENIRLQYIVGNLGLTGTDCDFLYMLQDALPVTGFGAGAGYDSMVGCEGALTYSDMLGRQHIVFVYVDDELCTISDDEIKEIYRDIFVTDQARWSYLLSLQPGTDNMRGYNLFSEYPDMESEFVLFHNYCAEYLDVARPTSEVLTDEEFEAYWTFRMNRISELEGGAMRVPQCVYSAGRVMSGEADELVILHYMFDDEGKAGYAVMMRFEP